MGLFNKNRTDGMTSDGADNSRKGVIDRIKYNGTQDELIWKFPYDNLTIGAQLIVNESQEAIFYRGGQALDSFGPGTHTLSAANIPLLQKLINLPFGGKTPFTAEVWYINKTVKRNLKWGTMTPIKLKDPEWGVVIPVRAYGEYGIFIEDARNFMTQIIGTLHTADTETIQEYFTSLIITKVTDTVSKYIIKEKVSVLDIPAHVDDVSKACKNRIDEEFDKYGLKVTNFYAESINYPDDNPEVQQISQSRANAIRRAQEGYTYQQERSFDVMDSAAGNEGNTGSVMGAGMGLGMGFGIGGAMGNMMGNMGNQLNSGQNQQQSGPPPPPQASIFVLVNNKQEGPFNVMQMTTLVQNGQITKDSMVWKEGMPQWGKAEDLPELANLFKGSAPPPPPPPQPEP